MLIAFEGLDFTGKSTVIDKLKQKINDFTNVESLFLREPGQTELGESVRNILMNQPKDFKISPYTKLLLFNSSRNEMLNNIVEPALKQNKLVFLDRFIASTFAYQVYGDELPIEKVRQSIKNLDFFDGSYENKVDLTVFLEVSENERNKRKASRFNNGKEDDLDKETDEFYSNVNKHYKKHVNETSKNVLVLNSELLNVEECAAKIILKLNELGMLERRF